jgi:hypothetical protein
MKRALLALVLLAGGAARAAPRPWAEGVAASEQSTALELFRQGNEAFARSDYAAAARPYREALDHWDHPAIRGNLAIVLINLDDPVGAYEQLEKALRFDEAPFEQAVYAELLTTRKLLLGQLGQVEVLCDVPGAVVTLDGVTLLTGPGQVQRVVRAGAHQVVAKKPRHLTFTSEVTALPASPLIIHVQLVPLEQAGTWERRWPEWKPWLVVGAGAAVLAAGVAFELQARSDLDGYEAEIARSCPSGCNPSDLPAAVRDLESGGKRDSRIGVAAMIVGGAALATGGVLVLMNQPRHVEVEESGRRIAAAPVVSPGFFGAAASMTF